MRLLAMSLPNVFALTLPGGQTVTAPGGLPNGGLTLLQSVIKNTLSLIITAVLIIVLLVIIWSGIQWITSGGDKTKVAAARARLTWSIVGLIIVATSFFIISIFSFLFHVNLLNFG